MTRGRSQALVMMIMDDDDDDEDDDDEDDDDNDDAFRLFSIFSAVSLSTCKRIFDVLPFSDIMAAFLHVSRGLKKEYQHPHARTSTATDRNGVTKGTNAAKVCSSG